MANEFKIKNGLIVSGSADFEQDLRVRGTLTVDEFHTSITTSSIIYESGSTRFGDTIDDSHTFTGSVNITGSISLNGQAIGTGKLDETTFNTYTSSYKVATSDFNGLTNSYNSFTTSYISASSSFNTRIGSLESFSSSLDVSFVNEVEFGLFSSSIKTFTSSLNNYTTSLDSKLNTIDSTTGSLNTYTSSANGRLNSIESATASLYSFSSSVNNRLSTVETSTGSLNSFSSSTNTRLNTIETSTSSLNSYSSSNDTRLGIIETSTSSLNSFTSSINTTIKNKLNSDGVISGSSQILNGSNVVSSSTQVTNYGFAITGSNLFKGDQTHSGSIIPAVDNAYDLGSPTYQWRDVYISSGSLYIDGTKVISSTTQELQITTDNGQSIKILESGTDSIILQTADGDIELKSNADGDILLDPTNGKIMLKGAVEILNGQKIQSSVGGTPVVFANDIVVSGSIDITGTIEGIDLTAFSSSVNTRLGNLESAGGNLNTFTSSAINRLSAIETSTSSLNTFTNSINTTIKSKLDADGVISGSSQISLGMTNGYTTFSSSVATSVNDLSSSMNSLSSSFSSTDTSHNTRLTTIEGRYATTGSNIFKGDQTITGSLYISQNLIVQGSSSLENITASAVSIGTNTIILNADTPAIRYAGISVFDSGSTNVTASLFYDSLTNNWKFKHSDVGTDDASILLYGPLGTGIDNAPTLVGNFLTKVEDNGHGHHLTTSSVFDNGTKISLKNNTEITGSLIITSTIVSQGTTLVSGSGQISYVGITNVPSGIVSGAVQVKSLLPTGTVSGSSQVLNGSGVWSGSAQLPSGIVSGSSQVSFNGITDKPTLVSGSSQVSFNGITDKPTLVSGSSQITFSGLSGIPSGIVSGSSQVLNGTTIHSGSFFNGITVVSGSAQISFNGITDKPTLVSGSSQVSFTGLSNIPGGLVSGSSQIDLTATTNYSTGIKTRLNAEGVISGSSQVTGIANSQLTNSSFHVGTTSISLGRTSASQTLTGVSIDGNAATVSNGVYTTGDQSIGGVKTFTGDVVTNGSTFKMKGAGGSAEFIWYRDYSGSPSEPGFVINNRAGATTFSHNANGGGTSVSGNFSAANFSGTSSGTNTGDQTNISGNAGTVTNGVYTTGDQTIGGIKTFTSELRLGTADVDVRVNRGRFQVWNNAGTGNLGYRIRTDENGGWRWQFVDGGNVEYFGVAYSSGNATILGTISASNFSGTSSGTNTGDQTNITGNAGTVTNGVYTTGNQSIAGAKTFTHIGVASEGTINLVSDDSFIRFRNTSRGVDEKQWDIRAVTTLDFRTINDANNSFATILSLSRSGQMSLSGSNSSGTPLVNLTATGTGTFQRGVRLLNSGMNAGDHIMMAVGQADGARNMGQFYFQYNGAGSTSNRLSLGLHSVDDVFNIWGNGNVEIGSTFNSGYKLDVAGQLRAYAGTPLIVSMSTVASNDAVIAARWTSGTGLEMRYNPNNALCYIDSTYPLSSGQVFGDIHIRQNVGGTMTSRMTFKAETGHILPGANGTQNLGSSSLRWNTVFTSDLSLSNGIGDYTIVEGEEKLYLYNNKNNKVYSFVLQEEDPTTATPKRPE